MRRARSDRLPCPETCTREAPCTPCRLRAASARYRARHPADPTKNQGKVRDWRAAHPERSALVQKEHYARNAEMYRERARRMNRIRGTGHSPAYFAHMLREQGDRCSVCRVLLDGIGPRIACADHDHRNGLPRGVLCTRCNTGLGWLEHDLTERLLAYRDNWLARHAETTDVD